MNIELFNKILYNSLDCDEITDDDKCLISAEPLEDDHITLECKHKFNYMHIFNEIQNQKKKSYYEITKLSLYQIKCPYCRSIQNGLIPVNKRYPTYVCKGINTPRTKCYIPNKCISIIKSGKKKGSICNKPCFLKVCKMHYAGHNALLNNDDDDDVFCDTILKYGKRKNLKCGKKCKTPESILIKKCLFHIKKYKTGVGDIIKI
jgi:hypothetical protein